jgi:hypothetical protein
MPPKRKVPTTVKEANLAPRAIKVAKKKHALVLTHFTRSFYIDMLILSF